MDKLLFPDLPALAGFLVFYSWHAVARLMADSIVEEVVAQAVENITENANKTGKVPGKNVAL